MNDTTIPTTTTPTTTTPTTTTPTTTTPTTTTPTTTLRVSGMTCGHCAGTVEQAARAVAGVEAARVDLRAGTLTVQGAVDKSVLAGAVRETGYDVEEP